MLYNNSVNNSAKNITQVSLPLNFSQEVLIMAYVISDDCISCGACAGECPVGCISEGDGKYVINGDECVSCGSCAGVCPVGAPAEA